MDKIIIEIRNVWFGREKLWKVFWLYAGLIGTILSFVIDILFFSGQFMLSTAFLSFYTVFVIWISKGIYACRLNVKNPQGLIPKIAVLFMVINVTLFAASLPRFFFQMENFRENPEAFEKIIESLKKPSAKNT